MPFVHGYSYAYMCNPHCDLLWRRYNSKFILKIQFAGVLFSAVVNAGRRGLPHVHLWLACQFLVKNLNVSLHCYTCFVLLSFYLPFILCICWHHFELPVSACSNLIKLLCPLSLKCALFKPISPVRNSLNTHCQLKLLYFTRHFISGCLY